MCVEFIMSVTVSHLMVFIHLPQSCYTFNTLMASVCMNSDGGADWGHSLGVHRHAAERERLDGSTNEGESCRKGKKGWLLHHPSSLNLSVSPYLLWTVTLQLLWQSPKVLSSHFSTEKSKLSSQFKTFCFKLVLYDEYLWLLFNLFLE